MGREIRRVPRNWEHPKRWCRHNPICNRSGECYQPLYYRSYEEDADNWIKDFNEWQRGEVRNKYTKGIKYAWDYHGMPPDKDWYIKYKIEKATWYQVYETVSEGTPVTPPFKTKKELVNYLVNFGDFWQQRNPDKGIGYSKEDAESFVYGAGWVPSFSICDGVMKKNIEIAGDMK